MAKRKSTKHTTKTKDRVTRTLIKTGGAKLYSYLISRRQIQLFLLKDFYLSMKEYIHAHDIHKFPLQEHLK